MNTATMDPTNSRRAYPILEAVEFLHDGQAAQHKLQAALPKQQAAEPPSWNQCITGVKATQPQFSILQLGKKKKKTIIPAVSSTDGLC